MSLEIHPPFAPMEALSVAELPAGDEWLYEPKWDGFRCLAFRDGGDVQLQSKSGQPLGRYFPEVLETLRKIRAERFVLDSELVIRVADGGLSFNDLLQRIHPAASRVRKLAAEVPATMVVFDLLAGEDGGSLVSCPLAERRKRLEAFASRYLKGVNGIVLSPATTQLKDARDWFRSAGAALDGVIAKRLDLPYEPGERGAMEKIKNYRSADCVVGGFRYAEARKEVGSLLLGLYDSEGLLNHVGFCSGIKNAERAELTRKLEALIEPPGFTGKAPGGPSRWSTRRTTEWQPLAPALVVEVTYDHFTSGRFRHGTKLLRWRPDKAPRQCGMEQVKQRQGNIGALIGV